MDGGAWQAAVRGVAKSQTRLSKESDTTERLHFHFSFSCIGEGNGNPLQCSCLENLGDGGASWAAVYGVPQSRTQLKRLSSSSIYSLGLHCLCVCVFFFYLAYLQHLFLPMDIICITTIQYQFKNCDKDSYVVLIIVDSDEVLSVRENKNAVKDTYKFVEQRVKDVF